MRYAKKVADQPVHQRSLINAFVVCCLVIIIPKLAKSKISRLKLVSVAEHNGLSLTWSQTPEDRFSRDAAQLYYCDLKLTVEKNLHHFIKTKQN